MASRMRRSSCFWVLAVAMRTNFVCLVRRLPCNSSCFFLAQPMISGLPMAGIKGVVADHVERFLRQVVLHDLVQVLVIPPGEVDVGKPAPLLVDAAESLIGRHLAVGIVGEKLGEDDFVRE